jgi:hypothetical protein
MALLSVSNANFFSPYRKLTPDQLHRLSQEIRGFLLSIDPEGDENLVTAQTEFTDLVGSLPESQTSDENSKTVAAEIADWIDEFLRSVLLSRFRQFILIILRTTLPGTYCSNASKISRYGRSGIRV